MHNLSPADELAQIRAEIARLRLREARLRQLLLACPELGQTGRWTRVEVEERVERRFDPALLPPALRDDPAHRAELRHMVLRCIPLPPPAPRPGWPMRRGPVLH